MHTNQSNMLVSASDDGLICFWDIFCGDFMKKVQAPTVGKRLNPISCVKFACEKTNQYVLVFYSEGEVLYLDSIKEHFLEQNGERAVTKVHKMSLVDVKKDFCLSVSQKG